MNIPLYRTFIIVVLAALASIATPASAATSTTTKYDLAFDGRTRHYMVTRPRSCIANCPVVIDMHGYLGSAEGQKKDSGLDRKAVVNGFIVVYPSGVQKSWNGGSDFGECCGYALSHKVDDVGFIRAVVAQVAADFPVDRRRVYASGLSNGCNMSQRLAVEAADVIAAAACTSQYLLVDAPLIRPIGMTEIHALNDKIARYPRTKAWPGAVDNFERWAVLNQCTGPSTRTYLTEQSYADVYDHCAGGVSVKLYSLANSEHVTYGHADGLDVAQIVWDNVKGYRLPRSLER